MGGFAAGAGFGGYAASKFAVEGLHEALAEELAPFGIRVTIVEPGVFATGFWHASARTEPIADYALPSYDREIGGHDPVWGVAEVRRAVADPHSGLRLPLGADAIGRIGAKLAAVTVNVTNRSRLFDGAEMDLKARRVR